MTRRGVLTGAAAIAGATALPPFLVHARRSLGHVILDERLADSVQFASGFNGTHVHAVSALSDLCSRWYLELRTQVLADAGNIAGLTTWMDYVVMHGCAAEIGYVAAFRAEHIPGTARIEHVVMAHPDVLSHVSKLDRTQSWAQAMGRALASGAHLRSRFLPGQEFTATTPAPGSGPVRMFSWVFSPRIHA